MKRKYTACWAVMLFLGLAIPNICHAITLNTSQTVVEAGQPVTITVQGTLNVSPSTGCVIQLSFGDSRQAVNSPECTNIGVPCGFTTTHTYQNAGTYTLRATASGSCSVGNFNGPDPALKTITVVDLNIQRMDLYFNNRQPKTTVKQYQRDLKAFAEIRYTGSGQLQGQWEIDGRLFFKVRKQLYRGRQKIVVQTPLAPPLPTYAVGSHQVQFVITRPDATMEAPRAIYFVSAEPDPFQAVIRLTAPQDRQSMVCEPTTFRWEAVTGAYVYQVEFVEAGGADPTFSAYAKKNEYTLRKDVCQSLFSTGRSYNWRVKGLNQEGHVIGQSETFRLILKK